MSKKLNKSAWLPAACLVVAWPVAHAQMATELPRNTETGDTLQFRVGAGLERDSNVLRAPVAQSDTAGIYSLGARIDKQISLQRIVLDAELATYKYQDFKDLNYTTLNYTAAYNYAFTPRFRGTVRADQREYRDTTTATTGVTQGFTARERNQRIEGTYTPGGGLLAQAGLSHRSSESDVPNSLDASPTVTSVYVGAGYEFASGTQAILQYRRGDGKYDNLATDFNENEIALVGRYPITPKTTLNGRIGWLERNHDTNSALDFDGLVGTLSANWDITGKTSLEGGFEREIGSYEVAGGGSVKLWRFYVQPVWRATEKIRVRLRYAFDSRDWSTASAAAPDAGREDDTNAYGVFVDWEPRRNLFVTGSLRQERRDSNINAFDYRANIVGLGARFVF